MVPIWYVRWRQPADSGIVVCAYNFEGPCQNHLLGTLVAPGGRRRWSSQTPIANARLSAYQEWKFGQFRNARDVGRLCTLRCRFENLDRVDIVDRWMPICPSVSGNQNRSATPGKSVSSSAEPRSRICLGRRLLVCGGNTLQVARRVLDPTALCWGALGRSSPRW